MSNVYTYDYWMDFLESLVGTDAEKITQMGLGKML